MQRKRNLGTLMVGMWIGPVAMRNSIEFSQNIKNRATI